MANINGIIGLNKSQSSVNKLLAAFGNDVIDVATGLGYGLNLNSSNNVEFEAFLDRIFIQNYSEIPKTFNGTSWTNEYVPRTMIAKYIKNYKEKNRIYLGNCKFANPQAPLDKDGNAIVFPSRVFYPDLFYGNNLTWGIEWGQNGKTQLDSPYFQLDQPIVQNFVTSNIKVGDPIFITYNNTVLSSKPYFVASIESPYRLKATENFPATATGLHFWVGSNWFDVATDDNDQTTGLGTNSTRLLVFKLLSLWLYTGSQLRQVKDVVGTSSHRSIINYGGYTYYFHGSDPAISGIYRFDGVNSVRVSKAIDPYIQGMDTANYSSVVAWAEGEELRFYLGNLTNANRDISLNNAVATLHTGNKAWDVSPIADTITCSATYRTSNRQDTYNGNSEGQVLKMKSGYNHNGDPIRMTLEKESIYPAGSETINEMIALQVIGRSTSGVKVRYKLRDKPKSVDDNWQPLGELSDDKTELVIPTRHNTASGIDLQFSENSVLENDLYIEKATLFYKPMQTRMIK